MYRFCTYCCATSKEASHVCKDGVTRKYLTAEEYFQACETSSPSYSQKLIDYSWCQHCGKVINTGGNDVYYSHFCTGKQRGYLEFRSYLDVSGKSGLSLDEINVL